MTNTLSRPPLFPLIGFLFLMAVPILHYYELENYSDWITAENSRNYTAIGIAAFLIFAGLLIPLNRLHIQFFAFPAASVFFLSLGVMLVGSIGGVNTFFSASYTAVLFLLSIVLIIFSPNLFAETLNPLRIVAWLILTLISGLFLYHDVSFPRVVGGVQPNALAQTALLALVMALLGGTSNKIFFLIFSLAVIAFCGSRGGVMFLFLFFMVQTILRYSLTSSTLRISMLLGIFVFLGSTFVWVYPKFLDILLNDVLAINHRTRGIFDTGFTGRIDFWQSGLQVFLDSSFFRQLFGHGFATRTSATNYSDIMLINSHSGFINLILDVGLLGASLTMISIFISLKIHIGNRNDAKIGLYSIYAASFIISYLFIMIFEPVYIRLGSPFSSLFLLLVVTARKRREVSCHIPRDCRPAS